KPTYLAPRRRRTRGARMQGKKSDRHADPAEPPRRCANKCKGHRTYENERPPVVGPPDSTRGDVTRGRANIPITQRGVGTSLPSLSALYAVIVNIGSTANGFLRCSALGSWLCTKLEHAPGFHSPTRVSSQ